MLGIQCQLLFRQDPQTKVSMFVQFQLYITGPQKCCLVPPSIPAHWISGLWAPSLQRWSLRSLFFRWWATFWTYDTCTMEWVKLFVPGWLWDWPAIPDLQSSLHPNWANLAWGHLSPWFQGIEIFLEQKCWKLSVLMELRLLLYFLV